MNKRDIFKCWAPLGMRWVDWVRPLAFVNMKPKANQMFTLPQRFVMDSYDENTALFLDLPGEEGVLLGLAYAQIGYRPIPLYNGTTPQTNAMSLVDNEGIEAALQWGASMMSAMAIPKDAAPVFLLDSNRLVRHKLNVSVFDNSWDLYNQDIPSPEYFKRCGIDKIVVVGETMHRDIKRIFYPFQKKGFRILHSNGLDKPKEVRIAKPPKKDKFH